MAIMNVGVVIIMIWVMFAILGISFLKDEMGYCSGLDDYYSINKNFCIETGHEWKTWPWNFDNIGSAFVTLYVLSSLEGWPDIMGTVFDAGTADTGPSFNNTKMFGFIYFVFFILVGALFLMNLFIGVIFFQFRTEQLKEEGKGFDAVSEEQMKWIIMQDLVENCLPDGDFAVPPKNKCRL